MNDFIKENYTTVFATKVDKIIKFEDFLQGMKDWEEGTIFIEYIIYSLFILFFIQEI